MKVKRFGGMRYTPASMCVCGCGRLMVFPRRGSEVAGRVAIYLNSWDGDPFYNPRIHARHLRKQWAAYVKAVAPEPVLEPPKQLLGIP